MPTGVYTRTEEHNKRISAALKGRPISEERKLKLLLSRKGARASEETRRKIGLASKNRTPWNKGKTGYHLHWSEDAKRRARPARPHKRGKHSWNFKTGLSSPSYKLLLA